MKTIEEVLVEIARRCSVARKTWYMPSEVPGELEELRDFILSGDDPSPWGPEPEAWEVEAHAEREGCSMGLWLARIDGEPVCLVSMNEDNASDLFVPAQWRPVDNEGALMPRPTRTEAP